MEVEIQSLKIAITSLIIRLAEHSQEPFHDAMRDELTEHETLVSKIEREFLTFDDLREKHADMMLRNVADSMLEAGKAMAAGIPTWELSECPMNLEKYVDADFQTRVAMLHDFNNYMRAMRDTNPKLLCKYFPYPVYFLNEMEKVKHFYIADHSRTDLWKGCMKVRKWMYNFQRRLDEVIEKNE